MEKAELRSRIYYRLRWLWPVLAVPGVKPGLKLLGWLLVVAYFGFISIVLGLRYWALPQVATHQTEIEQAVAKAVGMPVRIEQIEADWAGLNPRLSLSGVRILDAEGRQALAFTNVEAVLSWSTLWHFAPIMDLLAIDGPVLHIRRDTKGRITVAGVNAEGETDPQVIETLLKQHRIRIRNATIVWEDAQRSAPPLVLEDLQFGLDNRGRRHRFGLSAVPPEHLASRLEIRGELKGDLLAGLDELSGKIFAELDYADLAGWRAWVDYPFRLRQGRGALRLWGDWDEGRGGVTTDLALEDVQVRLGNNVPELQLASLRGRLQGRYRKNEWSIAGQKLELSTFSGARLTPTDFHAEWNESAKTGEITGAANATMIDLDALTQLALYLPLDPRSRSLLVTHQPTGRISELRASWNIKGDEVKKYALRGRFDGLGVLADGVFPGAKGLSGELDANERGGTIKLEGKDGGIDLPSVFPESFIPLSELHASANWRVNGPKVDVHLERFDFSSPDATGVARGSYRFTGEGPGEIDLSASISQADGRAVWRYLPKAVGQDARDWVRTGIVSGKGSDAKLTLRGNLRDFPFRDRSKGIFLITAKAKDVVIDYADGWPKIEGVDADMTFGVGMRIEASAGKILGTKVGKTIVELPDFDVMEEQLLVSGVVEGPTAEFLKFIDRSPVAENIDRFTDGMHALGDGRLELKLDMPLRHAVDTRINGEYRFLNNQVTIAPGMPAIAQVAGLLSFTEKSISAKEITGNVFGAPMRLALKNQGSKVQAAMSGGATARELRKFLDTPVLDHISGSTTWKGEVFVRKKTAEFVIESNLVGLSSSLPEPFNKTATAVMPLRFEKTALPRTADGKDRDQLVINVKGVAEALLQRREAGDAMQLERGALAVGAALPALPASGLAGEVYLAKVDGDFWRKAIAGPGSVPVSGSTNAAAPSAAPPFAISRLNVRTPMLHLFNRDFNTVELALSSRENGWQIGLNSKEAAGDLFWLSAGKGSLKADLKRLLIPAEVAAVAGEAAADLVDQLPALDIRVADLAIGEKRLGHLEAKAHNTAAGWTLDNLTLQNPDGSLKGKGEWRVRGGEQTSLDFELNAIDSGKLLERLGFAGSVKRGTAKLTGNLAWDGGLMKIHYPSLTGDLQVSAAKGQFAKLEPGLGKLLGLISLQSLPRRLTLDFRDVFSDGFAYDSIDGKLVVKGGVMRTVEDLKIDGPAARILIQGETDLKKETQNLDVKVQPEISGGVAAGVALVNPVIGIGAWVVNKVLQNPLNKMFAFQYRVTGTWDDPKVEKLGAPAEEKSADKPTDKPAEKPAVKAPEKTSEIPFVEKAAQS